MAIGRAVDRSYSGISSLIIGFGLFALDHSGVRLCTPAQDELGVALLRVIRRPLFPTPDGLRSDWTFEFTQDVWTSVRLRTTHHADGSMRN